MEQYIIKGGNPLVGDVTIGGAKNAALGILAASIMTVYALYSCTDLLDSFQHYINVPYIRKVIDQYILIRHDRGSQNT